MDLVVVTVSPEDCRGRLLLAGYDCESNGRLILLFPLFSGDVAPRTESEVDGEGAEGLDGPLTPLFEVG